jgi:hypothetical protein
VVEVAGVSEGSGVFEVGGVDDVGDDDVGVLVGEGVFDEGDFVGVGVGDGSSDGVVEGVVDGVVVGVGLVGVGLVALDEVVSVDVVVPPVVGSLVSLLGVGWLVPGVLTLVLGCWPTSPVGGRSSPVLRSTTPAVTAPARASTATAAISRGFRARGLSGVAVDGTAGGAATASVGPSLRSAAVGNHSAAAGSAVS